MNKPWNFSCTILRETDFLNLKFYLFNLQVSSNNEFLEIRNSPEPVYMIVQFPQQHVSEELIKKNSPDLINCNGIRKSFIASFSFKTFEIPKEILDDPKQLKNNIKFFLNWNKYKLITLREKFKNGEYDAGVSEIHESSYPLTLEKIFDSFSKGNLKNFSFKSGLKNVPFLPISFYESPRKIFMAFAPHDDDKSKIENYHIEYTNPSGALNQYFPKKLPENDIKLVEIWNRTIWYKYNETQKGPESKIIGFSGMFGTDNGIELQPSPLQRENLAKLTNLLPQEGQILSDRNIKYDFYNTGAFGESSQYNYFNSKPFDDSNPNEIKHYQIVGTKHITEQGKDNLDIITTRAVDVNTGLKIYVSVVSQRINNYKTSYLQQRFLIEYVTKEIDYANGDYDKRLPYKKIIAVDERKFFNPEQFAPHDGYAVLEENLIQNGKYPSNLLQFKYLGIDHDGKKHPFEMDMLFIPESTVKITDKIYEYKDMNTSILYEKGDSVPIHHQGLLNKNNDQGYKFNVILFEDNGWALNALKEINQRKAKHLNDHLFFVKDEITIASYSAGTKTIWKEKNDSDGNALLKTDGIFTIGVFENNIMPKFSKKVPVVPQLGFLNAYISQLKGIEKEPKTHQVTFSRNHYEKGKQGLDFLKTLELPQEKLIEITQIEVECIEAKILEQAKQIDNLSSNLLNSDSLINLDLKIDGLSFGNNALISSESIQDQINNLKVFDPTKIFGNAEILGFDLSKLFAQLLEEELPITKSIQTKVEDVETDITNILQDFETQHGNTGRLILKEWDDKIEDIKDKLKLARIEFETRKIEFEKLPELTFNNEIEKVEKLVRLVSEKIKFTSQQIISESNFDYHSFYQKNIYDVLINIDPSSVEVKIIKKLENDFIQRTDYFLKIISDRQSTTAFQIKRAKEKFLTEFLKLLISGLIRKIKSSTLKFNLSEKDRIHKKAKLILEAIIVKTFFKIYNSHGLLVLLEIQDIINRFEKDNNFPIIGVKDYEQYKEQIKALTPIIQQSIQLVLSNISQFNRQAISSIKDQITLVENNLTTNAKNMVKDYIKYLDIDSLNQEYRKIYKEYSNTKVYVEDFLKTFEYSNAKQETIKDELAKKINAIEVRLNEELEQNVRDYIQEINPVLQNKYNYIYDQLRNDPTINLLSNPKKFDEHFKDVFDYELEKFYDSKRRIFKNKINELEKNIKDFEFQIKSSINLLNESLEDQLKNLAKNEREQLERIQKILLSNRSQKVEYSFSNKNLKSIDAGLAKLITNKQSSLNVDSKVEILFKNEFPPTIEKKEAYIKTELTNLGVNIIDSIQVNFNRIYYQNGTNLPQDFKVEVRDIQFDGVFNFIAAFEEHLKGFGGDNLLLDFDATGATVGYKYPLPKIAFGYFNLFNLKLNVLFRLPFITGDPMKIILGINNPKDRFIVVVNGFPGTGYFFVELDPKKGVTTIAFLIEFGAHVSFNLGVARGSASFKAGIYYLKKYNKVDIGGYVICAGYFNVLGIFSASLLFNLRFKLIGNELIARGCVKTSYRFSRWFKVSATVPMKHKTSFDHSLSKQTLENRMISTKSFQCKKGITELQYAYSNLDQLLSLNQGDDIVLVIKYDTKEEAENNHRYELRYPNNENFNFINQKEVIHDSHLDTFYVRFNAKVKHLGKQKIVKLHENGDEIECVEINLVNDSIDDLSNQYEKAFFNSYFKTA